MAIEQISVFLENNSGRICEVTAALARAGVNLRAVSIADTADFGILRLIVDKQELAVQALSGAGFTARTTGVAAVEIDDTPGSLARVMDYLRDARVNIEYLYSSLEHKAGKAAVIFKLDNHEAGLNVLKTHGLVMIDSF